VEIYTKTNVGFDSVVVILSLLSELLEWNLERIPCANTIENWVKKSGYEVYHHCCCPAPEKEYAVIADESMMLGSEKMMLILGVDANKENDKALTQNDISVLDISVASSWNSSSIKNVLNETEEKVGHAPEYAIGDNDVKLAKAFRDQGYIHVRDAGHTAALQVEHVYGDDADFKVFTKELSAVKIREAMRQTSYLLPPRQRSIARFMNLSTVSDWATKMLSIFPTLNEEEQQTFQFVRTYQQLVEELDCVFHAVNALLKDIKNNGLSYKHTDHYLLHVNECLNSKYPRIRTNGTN
jgi:hypothetical protein